MTRLSDILGSGLRAPSKNDIKRIFTATGAAQQELFAAARAARQAAGVDAVKLRGVIEISNYCRKGCKYCAMRPQNKAMIRYRMDADTIQAIAQEIVHTGIGIVFLQAGEHPTADAIIAEAVPRIHKLGADVLLNVGERPRKVFADYARLGVGSYILKFETSDPQLYQRTVGSPLDRRLDCVGWIREVGMRLGTGNIVGLPGQTLDTLADDILLALRLGPDFVSASPFVPNENTPYEGNESGSVDLTLNSIALCRLLFPTALIPAVSALEKLRKDGQRLGLEAGANVLTINFTPKHFRDNYAIYSQGRFVVGLDHVRHTVARAGLAVQTLQ